MSQTFFDKWNLFKDLQDHNGFVTTTYAHDPVLSNQVCKDLDEAFKYIKSSKKKQREYVHLLSGLLYASDGSRFIGEPAKSGNNMYYYNSKNKLRMPQKKIDDLILQRAKEYFENSSTINKIFKDALKDKTLGLPIIQERIIETGKVIQDLENQLVAFSERVTKMVMEGYENLSVFQLIDEEKTKVEEKLKVSRNEIVDLRDQKKYLLTQMSSSNVDSFLSDGWRKLKKKSKSEIKTFLGKIIEGVVFDLDTQQGVTINIRTDPNGFSNKRTLARHNDGARVHLTSKWWDMLDLNQRPPGYEPGALTN